MKHESINNIGDNMQSNKDLLLKLTQLLSTALGIPPDKVETPVEYEVVIKSYNVEQEGIPLEEHGEEHKCLEVIMEVNTCDAHGNWYTPDTLVKGRESYENHRDSIPANLFHMVETEGFSVLETFILEEDTYYEAIKDTLMKGTWMGWTKYHDEELWEMKKSGDLGGISPACYADTDKETGEITNVSFTIEDLYKQREAALNIEDK